jgi:hypothetical protein
MTKRPKKLLRWTKQDIRDLKALARNKMGVKKIARALKRSEGATQQRAYSIGISLSTRG